MTIGGGCFMVVASGLRDWSCSEAAMLRKSILVRSLCSIVAALVRLGSPNCQPVVLLL